MIVPCWGFQKSRRMPWKNDIPKDRADKWQ